MVGDIIVIFKVITISSWSTSATLTMLLVELGHNRIGNGLEFLLLLIVIILLSGRVLIKPLDHLVGGLLDSLLVLFADLTTKLLLVVDLVLKSVRETLETITGVNILLIPLVVLSVLFSLANHALDVFLRKASFIGGYGDGLRGSSSLILRGDADNTVRVDLEGDLDLRYTAGSRRNAGKLEFSEKNIILGHGTLTLEHLDKYCRLVVLVGREGLGLLGWDHSVTLNKLGHYTTNSFDTHGKRGYIKKKKILGLLTTLTRENTTLDSSSVGYSLIRVDTAIRFLSIKEVLDELLDLGDAS
mmetsp:Transcript_16360/g.25919  ORF Transcript_16360/g.25919 Transcript_16360/m.25919 type:complete len:300 (+) Transcript_16360:176-1075(+)